MARPVCAARTIEIGELRGDEAMSVQLGSTDVLNPARFPERTEKECRAEIAGPFVIG